VGYIQQLVVKTTVAPWDSTEHDPLDALHAPFSKVFKILEHVEKLRHLHGYVNSILLPYIEKFMLLQYYGKLTLCGFLNSYSLISELAAWPWSVLIFMCF